MEIWDVCFACGKKRFSRATPMRCRECVKNKIPIQTSPVRDYFWFLTSDLDLTNDQIAQKLKSFKENDDQE